MQYPWILLFFIFQLKALGTEGMIKELIQYLHAAENRFSRYDTYMITPVYNTVLHSLVEAKEVINLGFLLYKHLFHSYIGYTVSAVWVYFFLFRAKWQRRFSNLWCLLEFHPMLQHITSWLIAVALLDVSDLHLPWSLWCYAMVSILKQWL